MSKTENENKGFNIELPPSTFIESGHVLLLVSLECPYCKDKIFDEDDMRELHVYLCHKDKLLECFEESYYLYHETSEGIEEAWNKFLKRVRKLEQEYLLLV